MHKAKQNKQMIIAAAIELFSYKDIIWSLIVSKTEHQDIDYLLLNLPICWKELLNICLPIPKQKPTY